MTVDEITSRCYIIQLLCSIIVGGGAAMLITQISEINNAEPPRQYLIQLKLKNKFKKLII